MGWGELVTMRGKVTVITNEGGTMTKQNFRNLSCSERDAYLQPQNAYEGWKVEAGFTDMLGQFGNPRIETTWVKEKVRVRDVRHPSRVLGEPDVKACEHYFWEGSNDNE